MPHADPTLGMRQPAEPRQTRHTQAPGSRPRPSWLPAAPSTTQHPAPTPGSAGADLLPCPRRVPLDATCPPAPTSGRELPPPQAGSPSPSIAVLLEGGEGTRRVNFGGRKSFVHQPNARCARRAATPQGTWLGWPGSGGGRAKESRSLHSRSSQRMGTTAPGSLGPSPPAPTSWGRRIPPPRPPAPSPAPAPPLLPHSCARFWVHPDVTSPCPGQPHFPRGRILLIQPPCHDAESPTRCPR